MEADARRTGDNNGHAIRQGRECLFLQVGLTDSAQSRMSVGILRLRNVITLTTEHESRVTLVLRAWNFSRLSRVAKKRIPLGIVSVQGVLYTSLLPDQPIVG